MQNSIAKLLDGVAVEWKALGEIGLLIRGSGLQKKDFTETGVPAIHYGQIYTYYGIFATETKSFVSAKLAEKLKKAKYGDILLAGTSENVKDVMTPLGWLGGEIVFSGDMFAFRPSNLINTKYLTYFLQTTPFQKFKEKYANGTKVIRISSEKFLTFKIPIPPLHVQTEIVRILDTFTELTAELTARKKLYNYYRDKLLTFKEDEVEWKALGEVVNYEQPTKYLVKSTSYSDEFKTPVLTAGKTFILGFTDEIDGIYEASETPVIIFDDFTTANKWVDFNFKAKSSAMKMISSTDESKYLLKYIYYWLNTLSEIKANNNHKRQWISNFANKKVPIPPLKEQARIVEILDKFDAITNSLCEGLPREIELRQKQYEYYRDLLLDFPKVEDK